MELRHLRYFVAVAEELNFTRAAEKLRLAQPSLTRQVHNLEEELGVRLLNRTHSRVTLTDAGRSFLLDARRLVAQSLESIQSVRRINQGETLQLNLGYLPQFNFDLLATTLTEFSCARPEIEVNLFDLPPAAQLCALGTRRIDLGFVGVRPPPSHQDLDALAWECIGHDRVMAVLPAKHPAAARAKIQLKDLKPLFFVVMSETTHPGSRAWLRALCHSAGYTPKIAQEVESESDLLSFVAQNLGVALAREKIKQLPHAGVVFRPLTTPMAADCWIAWHGENRSKPLDQYIQIIKRSARAGRDSFKASVA